MKIGVIGIGGVGSLISTRLSTTNNQIFCFGSRDSNEYLFKKGVSIESNFYGNSTYVPKQIIEKEDKLDLVFITLKGTKLESALENYRYLFNKNTIAVSLLNGLGHRETIRQKFGLKLIVGTIGSLEISLIDKRIAIHKTNNAPTVEIATSENNLKEDIKFVNDLLNQQYQNDCFLNLHKVYVFDYLFLLLILFLVLWIKQVYHYLQLKKMRYD